MKLGICAPVEKAAEIAKAGADYLEPGVSTLLEPSVPDDAWTGASKARDAAIPCRACNGLVPGSHKITGPNVDFAKLTDYMQIVTARAQKAGIETLVFGSSGARNLPDGFDRNKAKDQILAFVRMAAELGAKHNVTFVFEPLNKKESNILNSVGEAMEYVREINHPNFQCLVDSYHFWVENEPLDNLRAAMPWIKHVHVADLVGRVAPGESGQSDYQPFFKVLKEGGYDGKISVEANGFNDMVNVAPRVMKFLREQWASA